MLRLSILIPHKHAPENDKALAVALACIASNTRADYELLVDSETPADPYVVLNSLARRARGEYLFFSNSDIFVAPDWDTELLAQAVPDVMVNATLVEPGAIGVHIQNITQDFGMRPETFRRADFEAWAAGNPELPSGDGWVYYCLAHRQTFLDRGMFDLSRGLYPEPLDEYYRDRWLKDGYKIHRARSYIYHLQNYSSEFEQEKQVRHG